MATTFKVISPQHAVLFSKPGVEPVGSMLLCILNFIHSPPQLSVPSSCSTSPHESPTRTYPTGIATWCVCARTFPLSSAATRWTLKTEK